MDPSDEEVEMLDRKVGRMEKLLRECIADDTGLYELGLFAGTTADDEFETECIEKADELIERVKKELETS